MEKKGDVLVELVTDSFSEQKRYFASMNDDARSAVSKVDDWSPKDTMAHVAHWDSMMAADLADPENRAPAQNEADFNQTNAKIWEQYKESTWDEIEALVDRTQEEMVNSLRRLSEDDLNDPERFEWLNGRPLWRAVAFSNYYHALQHVAVLYAQQGDMAYANQIQEQAAKHQTRLSVSDELRGTVLYNLGCHYAVTGQRDKALINIGQGLKFYPVLSKWATDDPDLATLHDDPEFLSMIQGD
ncbi:MAG: ClbS/DfsB family four-helix bundle protein [Candidatus Promineifilaceae bacterium]